MKKLKIIFLIIMVTIVAYYTWDYVEFKSLQKNYIEKDKVKQLSLKTVESIHMGNTEFLNDVSGTDNVNNMLMKRMKILRDSKYDNVEIMETRAENRNSIMVVVLFSSEVYRFLEYTFIFEKIDNEWKIIDFKIF